jgi:invasion protein IalB
MSARYLELLSAIALGLGLFTSCVAMAQTPAQTPGQIPAQKKPAGVPAFGSGISTTTATGGPDMTSETYGDWIVRCQPTTDAKRCEASQTIIIQGQSSPIALIAFGREKKGDPLRMVIQLPTNISFESGVKTHLSNGEAAVDMKFRRCFPVGCFADAQMTDAVLTKLKGQAEPLSIKFKDGTEREISLPFSPKGLGPALDALSKL